MSKHRAAPSRALTPQRLALAIAIVLPAAGALAQETPPADATGDKPAAATPATLDQIQVTAVDFVEGSRELASCPAACRA